MRSIQLSALALTLWLAPDAASAGAGTGLSYARVTLDLAGHFSMAQSTPVDGRPRLMGATADKLAVLEVVGDLDDLTSATLAVAAPKDAPAALARNSGLLLAFARNATFHWPGSTKWVLAALKRTRETGRAVTVVRHGNLVTVPCGPIEPESEIFEAVEVGSNRLDLSGLLGFQEKPQGPGQAKPQTYREASGQGIVQDDQRVHALDSERQNLSLSRSQADGEGQHRGVARLADAQPLQAVEIWQRHAASET